MQLAVTACMACCMGVRCFSMSIVINDPIMIAIMIAIAAEVCMDSQ
jgi:hypothetical protein